MIAGETQATCFEMAKDFARLWVGRNAADIEGRMAELHLYTAFNSTAKSAFDMALYDLAAKAAGQPLVTYLGGVVKPMLTDLTIGIDTPEAMAEKASAFVKDGVSILKVKLGKDPLEDIERIRCIRQAAGSGTGIRIDANQGWSFDGAVNAFTGIAPYDIEFCEQPLHHRDDGRLPELRSKNLIKIMADESVFDHYDAERLLQARACDYVNIKFAKSGGMLEAKRIVDTCTQHNIPCMMGGMLESRVALSAFAHFAAAHEQIAFYDMDTCMLGHQADPVTGGVTYDNYRVLLPEGNGIGADVKDEFLAGCEHVAIN
jgi:L-Ala-D/L-Glu epimerase